ncbi:FMRFamide-related peptide FLP-12 precursor [Aphelenchoides avenae]|nr:FMRFamide-related peptide FLP-12 precursor [Aphelenchus avenae]
MSPFVHLTVLLLVVVNVFVSAQKPLLQRKGAPEIMEQPAYGGTGDNEVLEKVQAQLLGAMELLQAYEDAHAPSVPLKFTEKRRNKFEFIRFGRRRR